MVIINLGDPQFWIGAACMLIGFCLLGGLVALSEL